MHVNHNSYTQSFDLEGESGIVVRGIGTCVSVSSPSHQSFPTSPFQHSESLQFPEKYVQMLHM